MRQFARVPLAWPEGADAPVSASLAEALARIAAQVRLDGEVTLALAPQAAVVRRVTIPPVPQTQRDKVVAFEVQQVLPSPLEEAVWTQSVLAESDRESVVLFAAASREYVEGICRQAESAGFAVARVEPGCLALHRSLGYCHPGMLDGLVAVVEIDGRRVQVVLADPVAFAVRSATLAEEPVAGVGEDGAERDTAQAAREVVERVHLELARLLAAHGAGGGGERLRLDRVFLTGKGSKLPSLEALLSDRLGLPVAHFEPLRRVAVSAEARAAGACEHADGLARLVGLALPTETGAPCLNLLPPHLRHAHLSRRRRPYAVIAAAAMLTGVLVSGWGFTRVTRSARERTVGIEAALQAMAPAVAALAQEQAALEAAQQRLAGLTALSAARTAWVAFFDDLQSRLGEVDHVWLEGLKIIHATSPDDTRRLWLSGRMIDSERAGPGISGTSHRKVQTLWGSLLQSPFLASVDHERFELAQPGVLRFEVTFLMAPDPLL